MCSPTTMSKTHFVAQMTLENASFECSTIKCNLGSHQDVLNLVKEAQPPTPSLRGIIVTPLANDQLHASRLKGYKNMIAASPASTWLSWRTDSMTRPGTKFTPCPTCCPFDELGAHRVMTYHISKFTLDNHSWLEPMDFIAKHAQGKSWQLLTPRIGDLVDLEKNQNFPQWWKK